DFQFLEDLPDKHGYRCPHIATGAEPSRSSGTGTLACGPASQSALHGHADEREPRAAGGLSQATVVHRRTSRYGRRKPAGERLLDSACGRPAAGRDFVAGDATGAADLA